MTKYKIIILIQVIIIAIMGFIFRQESSQFDKLAKDSLFRDGIIQQLKKESDKEKSISDSLKKEFAGQLLYIKAKEESKTVVTQKYEKSLNNVSNLSDDQSVLFLTDRLSKEDINK